MFMADAPVGVADDKLDSFGASVDPDGVRRGDGGGRGIEGTRFCDVDIAM